MTTVRRAGAPRPVPTRPQTIRRRGEPATSDGAVTVFVEGLDVMASIGVHPHEHERRQRVVIDVHLELRPDVPPVRQDRLAETLDYQRIADQAARIADAGHVQLVETLAERLAAWCLEDARVAEARVRVAKPDALENAAAAGCVLTRRKP